MARYRSRTKKGQNLLDNLRRNDLARTAPSREAIEHHQRILGLERLIEFGLAIRLVVSRHILHNLSQSSPSCVPRFGTLKTYAMRLCTPCLLIVAEKCLAVPVVVDVCVRRAGRLIAVLVVLLLLLLLVKRREASVLLVDASLFRVAVSRLRLINDMKRRWGRLDGGFYWT